MVVRKLFRIAFALHFSHFFRTNSTYLVDISQLLHQNNAKNARKLRHICKKKVRRSANAMRKWNQKSHRIALQWEKNLAFFRIAQPSLLSRTSALHLYVQQMLPIPVRIRVRLKQALFNSAFYPIFSTCCYTARNGIIWYEIVTGVVYRRKRPYSYLWSMPHICPACRLGSHER